MELKVSPEYHSRCSAYKLRRSLKIRPMILQLAKNGHIQELLICPLVISLVEEHIVRSLVAERYLSKRFGLH
jgi:hypothetical protein